ncbi:MAG: cation diffusion facilitator family transporter, partial [Candidatus Hodarchaeales archaeon]
MKPNDVETSDSPRSTLTRREFKKSKFFQFHKDLPPPGRFAILSLAEAPKTIPEVIEEHDRSHQRIGYRMKERKRQEEDIAKCLNEGQVQGFICIEGERNGHPVYALTEEGLPFAQYLVGKMERVGHFVQRLPSAKNAIITSFVVHVVLGFLKVTIGVLAGSVALLADGVDSVVDAFSAIIVGITAKIKKETLGAVILLLLMIISGFTILYQSLYKLLSPEELEETVLAGVIAVLAIILCLALFYFQQYVGSKEQNMAILAQAQDSRNHVLVGLMVLVSVAASWFGWFFIDGLVGLLIGILILKATVELGTDLVKQSTGEKIDWERYALGGVAGTYIKLRIRETESSLLETCLEATINED